MILSWLTYSVEPDLTKGVIHAKTAYQVWEDFKDQLSQKNAPVIYQIQKLLASFSQGTMTVSTYFTKLKGLWDELDTYRALPTCNQMKAHDEQREEDRLMQFLMGLHDTYNVVHSSQSTHGVHSQDTNSSPGLSTDQLQQLAHALSMMTQNQKSPGNSDAYANAAGLGYGKDDWLGISRILEGDLEIFLIVKVWFLASFHSTTRLSQVILIPNAWLNHLATFNLSHALVTYSIEYTTVTVLDKVDLLAKYHSFLGRSCSSTGALFVPLKQSDSTY
ncbi:hypothetical protein RJ639_017507 [Escallonia herrerae]|uniref:Retrotransposon gag domain-containing protein n=1 Tax=Escallonia herrerae TaxID=1293975 RepID=A0AA88VE90_9ASTE|nr:hypothetical protein RJ639_017507 [Escallonia herrerae]